MIGTGLLHSHCQQQALKWQEGIHCRSTFIFNFRHKYSQECLCTCRTLIARHLRTVSRQQIRLQDIVSVVCAKYESPFSQVAQEQRAEVEDVAGAEPMVSNVQEESQAALPHARSSDTGNVGALRPTGIDDTAKARPCLKHQSVMQ